MGSLKPRASSKLVSVVVCASTVKKRTYAGEENYNSQEKHCPRMTRVFNNPRPVPPRCTSLISELENLVIQQPKVPKVPMNDDPFNSIVSYKRTMHPSAYVAADELSYRPNRPGTPTREPIVQPGRLPATSAMSCKFFSYGRRPDSFAWPDASFSSCHLNKNVQA